MPSLFRLVVLPSLTMMLFQAAPVCAQEKNRFVSKQIAIKLKSSPFLMEYDKRKYVNFDADCGVDMSVKEIESYKPGEDSFLIDDVANLGKRVGNYPFVLKTLGKWDKTAEARHKDLKETYNSAIKIANSDESQVRKLRDAKPVLSNAEKISKKMARAAGIAYEADCGAFPEDSQTVDFVISPEPKLALYIVEMDFDKCKMVLTDPYDATKCQAWTPIQQAGNELSGRYLYRVTWPDGSVSTERFAALGTKHKTLRITKP